MKKDILSIVEYELQRQKENMYDYYLKVDENDVYKEDRYKEFELDLNNLEFTRSEDQAYILGMVHAFEIVIESLKNN